MGISLTALILVIALMAHGLYIRNTFVRHLKQGGMKLVAFPLLVHAACAFFLVVTIWTGLINVLYGFIVFSTIGFVLIMCWIVRRYGWLPVAHVAIFFSVFALFVYVVANSHNGREIKNSKDDRPPYLPANAIWAGGADGGAWVSFTLINSDSPIYSCTTYTESSGDTASAGLYILKEYYWDTSTQSRILLPVSNAPNIVAFNCFDGIEIVVSDTLVLEPDGWIYWPGAGKKVLYPMGDGDGIEMPIAEPGR